MKYFYCLLFSILFTGCKTNLAELPAFSASKQLQVVIETPAGAGYQNKFNPQTGQFQKVQEAGQDKVIRFLPSPVNAGFIPSTREPKAPGSNGQPLSVLLIVGSQEPGTVTEIMPLGVLILETAGEINYQVVATPAKPSERLISATSYEDFVRQNTAVKKILEMWFTNYAPTEKTRIMAWKDDRFADELIRKWMK